MWHCSLRDKNRVNAQRDAAHALQGQDDKALADLSEAIRLKPDYGEAYYNRGAAYKRAGDTARATQGLTGPK